jgi:hypothetical protein
MDTFSISIEPKGIHGGIRVLQAWYQFQSFSIPIEKLEKLM